MVLAWSAIGGCAAAPHWEPARGSLPRPPPPARRTTARRPSPLRPPVLGSLAQARLAFACLYAGLPRLSETLGGCCLPA